MIDFDTAQVRSHPLLQAPRDRAHQPRAAVPAQTDCRRACAAKAIREGARKAGSAAAQQTSAPATDDSSVERSDELFAALRPIFLRLTPTDKRAAQRLPLSVVIRRQLCGQILIGPEGLPTQVDVELTQVRSVAHITFVGGPGVFGLHLERLVRRLGTD